MDRQRFRTYYQPRPAVRPRPVQPVPIDTVTPAQTPPPAPVEVPQPVQPPQAPAAVAPAPVEYTPQPQLQSESAHISLSDAPDAASITPLIAPLPPAAPVPAKEVTINVQLPKLHLPRLSATQRAAILARLQRVQVPPVVRAYAVQAFGWLQARTGKQRAVLAGAASVLIVAVIAQQALPSLRHSGATATVRTTPTAGQEVARTEPSFALVVPKGKPELAQPKENVSVYDGTRDVYSFRDSLQGTSFIVSQQALPDTGRTADDVLQTVAGNIGAKEELRLDGGRIAYMNTDKYEHQTLVTYKDRTLIIIQSGFKHDALSWIDYLNSLQ